MINSDEDSLAKFHNYSCKLNLELYPCLYEQNEWLEMYSHSKIKGLFATFCVYSSCISHSLERTLRGNVAGYGWQTTPFFEERS